MLWSTPHFARHGVLGDSDEESCLPRALDAELGNQDNICPRVRSLKLSLRTPHHIVLKRGYDSFL